MSKITSRNLALAPETSRHLPQCEFRETTDRDMLRAVLRIRPGLNPGYDWVERNACSAGWQVPHYAAHSLE
jgi:hypothetical protein